MLIPTARFTAVLQRTAPAFPLNSTTPTGVPISAIIFGGQYVLKLPLWCISHVDWQPRRTFVGSIMASETTAAAAGRCRRCSSRPHGDACRSVGYDMGDYFGTLDRNGQKAGRQGA